MMARKVFFSFHYRLDHWRVNQVRNSNVIHDLDKAPFLNLVKWEAIKRSGDLAVKRWIEKQLKGTSVTVVLIGAETSGRRWVKYEIKRSIELGKGLLGIDISKIKDRNRKTTTRGPNPLPSGYPIYLWNKHDGAMQACGHASPAASSMQATPRGPNGFSRSPTTPPRKGGDRSTDTDPAALRLVIA